MSVRSSPQLQFTDLLESVDSLVDLWEDFGRGGIFTEAQIDKTSHTIRNVKMLGAVSANGREYSAQALEDAARLYNGVRFFVDHPTEDDLRARKGQRSFHDLAGRFNNTRRQGHEVRGDLHLIPGPVAEKVLQVAEAMPEIAGMSHRASGTVRSENGKQIVESLTSVAGVELVTEPATTAGFFESRQTPESEIMDLATLKTKHPDLVQAVLAEQKDDQTLTELRKTVETLTEAKKAADKKIDEFEAKEKLAEHKAAVETKLKEAKLPEQLVTKHFRQQLDEAKDLAAVDALIADRKELAEKTKVTRPQQLERTVVTQSTPGEFKPLDESVDYGALLGVR